MTQDPAISADKRSRILEIARTRFLHYGVSKTSMRDIAQDLGISVSNLYLYFENKRELVLAIAQSCRAEQDKGMEGVLKDASLKPGQKLEKLLVEKFRKMRNFRNGHPKGKELSAYLLKEFPERRKEWEETLENNIRIILDEGSASGYFCIEDTKHSAHMLRIATAQFFVQAHVELPSLPTETELVALIHWFLAQIETKASQKERELARL